VTKENFFKLQNLSLKITPTTNSTKQFVISDVYIQVRVQDKAIKNANKIKKMQSEAADFAPSAAARRTRRNTHAVSDSAHSLF